MAIFIRRNVSDEFIQTAEARYQEQAEVNARYLQTWSDEGSLQDFVAANGTSNVSHLIVDQHGVILATSDSSQVGEQLQDLYTSTTVNHLLAGKSGYTLDAKSSYIIGYAPVKGKTWTDVVAVNNSRVAAILNRLIEASSLQLAVSLFIISVAGGVVIWIVVGHPLQLLTDAATKIGEGSLDDKVDPDEMEGELRLLADALNRTGNQIKALVVGLEERVREINNAYSSLQNSEERFRAIFDSVNDTIFVLDIRTGAILDVNQKITEMYGYTRDEVLKMHIGDLSSGNAPYVQRNALQWIRRARRFGPQVLEWRARHKDGALFWVEFNMRVAIIGGQNKLILTVRDINERKRAEQMQVAVYRIFQTAQSTQTLYEFSFLIHGIIEGLLPARNFLVAFYDPASDLFTYPYHFDQHENWPSIHGTDNSMIAYVLRTGQPLLIRPEELDGLGLALKENERPFAQWLGCPLQTSHGVLGVLAIKNYDPDIVLDKQDVETFAFITTQVAMAVERKQAEDALHESEARWRALMENAPQLIMTVDRHGQILFVNRTIHGIAREQALNNTIFDYLPGKEKPSKEKLLQQVFIEHETVAFELRLQPADKEEIWLSCNVAPVVDQERVDLAIFNASEITGLKRAEQAVRESEELYRRAIEAAGAVPYYRNYNQNNFIFIGKGILDITGYSAEEITAETWDSLVRGRFLLSGRKSETFDESVQRARRGEMGIWQCDYEIRTRTGETRWVYDASVELLGADGQSRGSIGIMQDITARKLSEEALRQGEEKFRTIVEQLSEGLALVDENGYVLEWNTAQEEIYKVTRSEALGKLIWDATKDVFTSEDAEGRQRVRSKTDFKRALKTGRARYLNHPVEFIIHTSDGTEIWVQQTAFAIHTEKGFRIGLLSRDITQQKHAAAEIHNLNEALEQRVIERTADLEAANRELEAFSYSISHDLRAPLRAIDGFSRILADSVAQSESDEINRIINVIRDNAQQMGRLIDDLLAFSRLSRQPLRKQLFSSAQVVAQALEVLSADQVGREVEINMQQLPDCEGDPVLIKQVWVNLLSNAFKFTRKRKKALIEIGGRVQEDEIIFSVKDNGTGFDMRYAGKLFGVFQRLHPVEEYEGTGVGLAIVQRIVRRHGGRAWAESVLNRGATFYFALPIENEKSR